MRRNAPFHVVLGACRVGGRLGACRPIPTQDPAHWQGRTDEARLQAPQANDPEIKTALLDIALACERLAQIVAKSQHERVD
jgi:hypothetical protein